jgi:PKD repeat protein
VSIPVARHPVDVVNNALERPGLGAYADVMNRGRPIRLATRQLVMAVVLVLVAIGANAAQTSLAWDPVPDPRVVGYSVHYGTASGSYTTSIPVGNLTSYTVTGIPSGNVYFFAISAYDASGAHSAYSNEVRVAHLVQHTAPSTSFDATPVSGAAPLTVDFVSTSGGTISGYSWDFGDGASASSAGSPAPATTRHTYQVPGIYTVRLTATGPGGSHTTTRANLVTVSGTVPPTPQPATGDATVTLFGNAAPRSSTSPDTGAATLGVRFVATTGGEIRGIRFYKGPYNTGTHTAQLWSSSGQLLAFATFTNESATGWQTVLFARPVTIAANVTYVASYHAPRGHYAGDPGYFVKAFTSGPLRAPASTTTQPNGVHRYGATPGFPTESWKQSNHWVDVVFAPSD